jgi:hypothetical protein
LGGVGTFGVFACVQEVAVAPGELLANADLIHQGKSRKQKVEIGGQRLVGGRGETLKC